MVKFYFLIACMILGSDALCQINELDAKKINSLKILIEEAKHDTIIVNALIEWNKLIYQTDTETDLLLNLRIDSICKYNLAKSLTKNEKSSFLKSHCYSLRSLSNIYHLKGNSHLSKLYLNNALTKARKLNDLLIIAAIFNDLGTVMQSEGNYTEALNNYFDALSINIKKNDSLGISVNYSNISGVHNMLGNFDEALDYANKSHEITLKLKEPFGIAASYNSFGTIYQNMLVEFKNKAFFKKSLANYEKALAISEEINDKDGIASNLNQIGYLMIQHKNYDTASIYFTKSLLLFRELDYKNSIASCLNGLADISLEKKLYSQSFKYATEANRLADESQDIHEKNEACFNLYRYYNEMKDSKNTLKMYQEYILTRDSIENENNQKAVFRQKYKHNFETKAAQDSLKSVEEKKVTDAQLAKQDAEIKTKKYQQYILFGGLIILISFLLFIYNRFRITRRQKLIIESQKSIVESAHHQLAEKNKEVIDSINYAKRIQSAILPPDKLILESFPNHFIFYQPKDIVAGDFYWFLKKENQIFIAVADCTGHGVPGALVSVVCHGALNRAVKEFNLSDPGNILDKTREIVVEEFSKSEEDVKDGMDISLIKIEIINGEIVKLKWSGANNPLWYVQNNEMKEIKADKQPIGKTENPVAFTSHSIPLSTSSLFLITDGFADQFGGAKGKKYKYSLLQKWLVANSNLSPTKLKENLEREFNHWKGNLEQVDDVTIIGIKI